LPFLGFGRDKPNTRKDKDMKTPTALCGLLTGLLLLAATLHAEGPLDPPGAPAPTMKTLQELWDKIGELEAQLDKIGGVVSIEMVTVGNAMNAADTTGLGDVSYNYKVGRFEVTNAQYAQFLNAVAPADPNALYNPLMASNVRGGIAQSATSPTPSSNCPPSSWASPPCSWWSGSCNATGCVDAIPNTPVRTDMTDGNESILLPHERSPRPSGRGGPSF
jgi:hypothetical protein